MKKELYLPIIIVALTLVFGAICLMVYLSDGNAYWIKKKLKIGALILSFAWMSNSCEKTVICYAPVMPENSIWIDNHGDSLIYSINDTMFIRLHNPTYQFFSFDILDDFSNSLKTGLLPKDSLMHNYYLIISDEFLPGNYTINFYGEADSLVLKKNKITSFDFQIK